MITQIIHHLEPEFAPLVGRDPQAQNLAFALCIDAQSHVNGLVFDLAAFRVADLMRSASRKTIGYIGSKARFCQSETSSRTASLTRLIRAADTFKP